MVDYDNIYTILSDEVPKLPEDKDEIYREIISIIKKYNLSLVQSATVFNIIIKKLAYTPINEL